MQSVRWDHSCWHTRRHCCSREGDSRNIRRSEVIYTFWGARCSDAGALRLAKGLDRHKPVARKLDSCLQPVHPEVNGSVSRSRSNDTPLTRK